MTKTPRSGNRDTRPFEERFFSRVQYSDNCWEWQGVVHKNGYGTLGRYRAHRLSYEYFIGPLGSLYCCHHCDNKKCVNPFHLFAGTHQDNVTDMMEKGRYRNPNSEKTHCKRGHEFNEENTYVQEKTGQRFCRKCDAIKSRKAYNIAKWGKK